MKKIILSLIIFVGIFALINCGNRSEKDTVKSEKETGKKVLKPGDVNPNNAVKLDDLVEGTIADVNGWKGKEVAVTGYVVGVSGSTITFINDKDSKSKNSMSCDVSGALPDGMLSKPVEVKGKIKRIVVSDYNSETRYSVEFDPCELKK